ncbi:MAG: type II secretion system major pseudopilin GspG [Verrucomicrobiota bacterium]
MFTQRIPRSLSSVRRGFTLVEVLLVLAILGLLVGVLATKVDGIFGGSQESVSRLFVSESMKTPLVRYRIDLGDYPSTAEGLQALITPPAGRADRWKGPYIEITTGGGVPLDPWGEPYQYRYPAKNNPNAGGYDLFSKGKDKVADTPDDIGNW